MTMDSEKEFEKWLDTKSWDMRKYDLVKSAFLAGIRIGMERSAEICDRECDRVLSKQSGEETGFMQGVDTNIRMMALLLPDVASAIRGEMPP